VFLGLGPRERDRFPADLFGEVEDESETEEARDRTPISMFVPAALLLAAGLALGVLPGLSGGAQRAAARFEDQGAYAESVLTGRAPVERAVRVHEPGTSGRVYGGLSAAGAVALAALVLFRKRLPARVRRRGRALAPPLVALRRAHSGHIGDYIAWLTLGLAGVGGLFSLALR
jgi:multicomponent Na+:H+ antiporter subunit D